ncbi:MAG: ATP-binding protein [Vicinamibacterales bacterium]|nr:ATP-binding protein [Vicinamibacterales bacterium]
MATIDSSTHRVAATAGGVRKAAGALARFTKARRIAHDDAWPVQLALLEWLTNIVEHGYRDRPNGVIDVSYLLTDGALAVTVTDDGPAFDPLSLPPPDTGQPIEDREPGGLGVHFIRQLMDHAEYRRADGRNTLVFRKKVGRT